MPNELKGFYVDTQERRKQQAKLPHDSMHACICLTVIFQRADSSRGTSQSTRRDSTMKQNSRNQIQRPRKGQQCKRKISMCICGVNVFQYWGISLRIVYSGCKMIVISAVDTTAAVNINLNCMITCSFEGRHIEDSMMSFVYSTNELVGLVVYAMHCTVRNTVLTIIYELMTECARQSYQTIVIKLRFFHAVC